MEGTIAPEQIIINGQEYSPEDASSLIELGNKYRQMEKDLNTPLDKLMPKYTMASQRAARADQLERDLAEQKRLNEEYQAKVKQQSTPPERTDALKVARELGLADMEYLQQEGYIKKSDLEEFFNQKKSEQQLIDNVLNQASVLEKEIDGSDGRVPFNQKAVLAYAGAYNISDLKQAYEEMNESANTKWKNDQIAKTERPGLTTLRPGGKKAPTEVKVTDDNFKQLWDELYGNAE